MSAAHIIDDRPFRPFHRKVTLLAAGGPFLDGYIIAGIGAALVGAVADLQLSDVELGLVASTALIGIFFGGLLGGRLADLIGRQKLYAFDLSAMLIASVLCVFVQEGWQLVLARLLAGVAVGVDYPIATAMLAEWMPAKRRGRMMSMLTVMFGVGMIAAYLVALAAEVVGVTSGWRWVLGSAGIPALVLLLARAGTPESPRWLMSRGRTQDALGAIERAFGESCSDAELAILAQSEPKARSRVRELFKRPYLGRTIFAGTFWLCQVTPTFAIQSFYPIILGAYGFSSGLMSLAWAMILTGLGLLFTLPAMFWVDRFGRRPMLIWSFAGSVLALAVLGLFPDIPALPVILLLTTYNLAASAGSLLQFIYPVELFPTEIRASAMGVATAISRIGSALSTFLVPIALTGLGLGPTMLVGTAIALTGTVIALKWAPETRDRPLHEAATAETPTPTAAAPVRPETCRHSATATATIENGTSHAT